VQRALVEPGCSFEAIQGLKLLRVQSIELATDGHLGLRVGDGHREGAEVVELETLELGGSLKGGAGELMVKALPALQAAVDEHQADIIRSSAGPTHDDCVADCSGRFLGGNGVDSSPSGEEVLIVWRP